MSADRCEHRVWTLCDDGEFQCRDCGLIEAEIDDEDE